MLQGTLIAGRWWWWRSSLAPAAATFLSLWAAVPVAARTPISAGSGILSSLKAELPETVETLRESRDLEAAERSLSNLFDRVCLLAPDGEADLFRDTAYVLRLVRQLRQVDEAIRDDLLAYLLEHPSLARELAFLVRSDVEKPEEVYGVLDRMRRARGAKLAEYPTLTAAICVVHDRPLERRINENRARSPDPMALFDYFVANERRLYFGLRSVPAELLVYVVDCAADVDEMHRALDRYAGHDSVGGLFFTIEFDDDHFRRGAPKKVTQAGWSLPNILRFGGVCADQAHFAVTVGKSIGVPTAYTWGAGGDLRHAWAGFLQADGRGGWWNFDMGRYEAYRGVRGNALDPQIRRQIPDSYVSLLAQLIGTTSDDRQRCAALTDAARRLAELDAAPAPPGSGPGGRPARGTDVRSRLKLLESALRRCSGYARAWFAVRDLAERGALSLEQKKRWSAVLDRLCGQLYPDFVLAILEPMIVSVEEVPQQNRFWNAAFGRMQACGRADLAARVRMSQGRMWEQAGELEHAGQCYEDVLKRFANAGPFVIEALVAAERLLRDNGRGDLVVALYEQTWSRIERPQEMAAVFRRQSNWHRVGTMYARRLEDAGGRAEAQSIRDMLAK